MNTNGNGHLIDNALSLVCEALGPFRYDLSHHNYVHFPLFLNHWKITKQLSLGILNPSNLQYIVFQHYNKRKRALRLSLVHPDSLEGNPVRPQERLRREEGRVRLAVRALQCPPRPRLEGAEQVQPGTNCIKLGISGKSILRDYFQENRTSRRPFFLLRISFPGRFIFIQLPPGHEEEEELCPLRLLASATGLGVRVRHRHQRQRDLATCGSRVGRVRRQETGEQFNSFSEIRKDSEKDL